MTIKDEIESMGESQEKKKRGRKKKPDEKLLSNNIVMIIEETEPVVTEEPDLKTEASAADSILKKRGRKSKGGKLIMKQPIETKENHSMTNIILHLKCSTQDLIEHNDKINKIVTNPLTYNPNIPPSIVSYNMNDISSFSLYEDSELPKPLLNEPCREPPNDIAYEEMKMKPCQPEINTNICSLCSDKIAFEEPEEDASVNMKDINIKLKKIKLQLYNNTNPEKKSACFWCTYSFDNQTCYIPKYEMDGQLYGYGSFCRPECAAAYLLKENIDDSTKFERYHLLNQIYCRVYDYKKNIKPAPNPFYLLEKYYGNLSIQEYRKLLKSEHMLLVVEKPMTRILPELHEDSDDFMTNIYSGGNTSGISKAITSTSGAHSGVYKVKRQSEKQKGVSKTSILKENFLGGAAASVSTMASRNSA
jgi:hypothetical protein